MAPIMSSILALGAGCYWGTEKYIVHEFQQQYPGSILNAKVGFMSPDKDVPILNPTYERVCDGDTTYVEVLQVELNPNMNDLSLEDLFEEVIKFFFTFHDPTTKNRQGNDAGTQYASVIFCSDAIQTKIATKVKRELQMAMDSKLIKTSYHRKSIETLITDYTEFTPAHEEHQEYLKKNPWGYCNHRFRFRDWPEL